MHCRLTLILGFGLARGVSADAQAPVKADTAARDTSRAQELPELKVTVTRTEEALQKVPYAVGVLDRTQIQRGQLTIGLDEALNNLQHSSATPGRPTTTAPRSASPWLRYAD